MADNVAITAGSGTTIAADDIGAGVLVQRVKATWGADGTANDTSAANPLPVVQTGTPALPTGAATSAKQPALGTAGAASTDVITVQGIASGVALPVSESGTWTVQPGNTQNTTPWLVSPLVTAIDVTLTRPNDTTAYAANDEISSSTSAPTVNTITNAARASGGYVRLTNAICVDSSNVATKAQLLVYIFDTTTTPNNDNAAFAPSDSVLNTCVAVLPFNVWYPGDDTSGAGGNAFSRYLGDVIDIKTAGSANLFFRVKVLNAYAPTAQEAFVFRFDFIQY